MIDYCIQWILKLANKGVVLIDTPRIHWLNRVDDASLL